MFGNSITRFRLVSLAEATSFLLLLVATAVKYGADQPVGVEILGPIHGVLFIAYCLLALDVRAVLHWDIKKMLLVIGAAILPCAPFFVERGLREAQRQQETVAV